MATDMVGNYLKKKAYGSSATSDMQTIPARHGVATFVPAGSTIKIVNTSGNQVVDTWAFALPNPPETNPKKEQAKPAEKPQEPEPPKQTPKKNTRNSKGGLDLPSQEDAEKATAEGIPEEADAAQKKSGWSSYLPSIGLRGKTAEARKQETKENSRTWSSYLGGAGQGFTSYVPSKDDVSGFARSHYRDTNKSYVEQLADFSRTPVGSAGISALSGSGYASSIYAGYSAWQSGLGGDGAPMEYLSMPHSRASTEHLVPRVNDILVSNLREPMLTIVEDSSPGIHDTLIAACDPQRYKALGVESWEQHGSCAENLVLALKQLNDRAGLKGPKGIGAEVTVNAVPAPLNLFMNIPWTNSGDLSFESPGSKQGDYIRMRAERDVVVVMSACPQDVLPINAKNPEDAHFIVTEGDDEEEGADVRDRLQAAESQKQNPKPQRPSPAPRTATPKKANGTSAAPSKPAAASSAPAPAQARKPAAATGGAPAAKKTPIGSTKTPVGQKKAPIGQTKAKPATSSPTSAASGAQKARTPIGTTKTPKNAAPAKAAESAPAKAVDETEKKETAAPAAPVERKKPRKLVRSTPAPSSAGD